MKNPVERPHSTTEASFSENAQAAHRHEEEAVVSLTCKKHGDRPARARCVGCGKLLCESCRHKVGPRNYCEACIQATSRARNGKTGRGPKKKSPFLAALLSVVPGLGQLYCGRPLRAMLLFATSLWMAHQMVPRLFASLQRPPGDYTSIPSAASRLVGGSGPFLSEPVTSLIAMMLPFLALVFLGLCDAIALARRSRNPQTGSVMSATVKRPSKRRFAPDLAFLGLTAAGLGAVIVLQHSSAPWLSVSIMWPVALVLFGLTVAFSRA